MRSLGRLNASVDARISPAMSIPKLLALFVAIAILLVPGLTHAGAALAAVPDHQMQMMETGHCMSPPESADAGAATGHHKPAGDHKSAGHDKAGCCISMCMAVAVSPPAMAAADVPLHNDTATFILVNQYHGRITEIATPPPRIA